MARLARAAVAAYPHHLPTWRGLLDGKLAEATAGDVQAGWLLAKDPDPGYGLPDTATGPGTCYP